MADAFGAVQVPLVVPADGTSAGDPLLSTTLAFFQAVLNANAPAAWRAVFKDAPQADVVKTTHDDDPRSTTFNDNDLPALFLWREDVKDPIWLAEDWLTQDSTCRLLWVMPPGIQVKRAVRSSIINAIARVLLVIVERDRDPSWIADGDPDSSAPTLGSSFSGQAGWMDFTLGQWKPLSLAIPMLDGAPRTYDALSIACAVTERLVYDLSVFAPNVNTTATFTVPDDGTGGGLGPMDVGDAIYT